jgi:hypothetical protein
MKCMRFWQIHSPDYSDYRHSYINGALAYFRLPPVRCKTCGKGQASDQVLPFALPASFHSHSQIRKGWPISQEDFDRLTGEIQRELRSSGVQAPELKPGDMFEPGELDVPSKPQAFFLEGRCS